MLSGKGILKKQNSQLSMALNLYGSNPLTSDFKKAMVSKLIPACSYK